MGKYAEKANTTKNVKYNETFLTLSFYKLSKYNFYIVLLLLFWQYFVCIFYATLLYKMLKV